jgi:hypothetical protein
VAIAAQEDADKILKPRDKIAQSRFLIIDQPDGLIAKGRRIKAEE